MFALLAQRNVALLWFGHNVSILGDYIFFIAIAFWVYQRTGSALATGAILISSTAPLLLFAPVAGHVVDRWDRRLVMLLAESARAFLFLALLGAVVWRPEALWPIYAVGFAQSALAAFFWPARSAAVPQLVAQSSLLSANALFQFSDGVVRVVAPTLAGLALLRLGVAGVIALDGVTFIVSAGCIAQLAPLVPPPNETLVGQCAPTVAMQAPRSAESATGSSAADAQRVGAVFAIGGAIALTAGALSILLSIFVRATLAADPLVYGWMFSAQAIGEVAFSALVGVRRRRSMTPQENLTAQPVSLGLVVGGLALTGIALARRQTPSLAFNLLFGAVTALATLHLLTWLQLGATNTLGRRLARYAAIQACAQLLGMALASVFAASVGAAWLIALMGLLYLFSGGLAWALFAEPRSGRMFHVKHTPRWKR